MCNFPINKSDFRPFSAFVLASGAAGCYYAIISGPAALTTDVLANNNTYKLAQVYDSQVKTVLNAGVLQPWNNVPYVDLEADWWNQSAADTFTISGKVFGAVGDFNLSEYSKAYMIYFNKDIYKSIEQEKSLYDYVLDGTWTLDRMITIAQQYARDPESTQIIDIIFDSACFDAGVLMWYSLRETYMSGPFFTLTDTLASTTKMVQRVAEAEIKQTVKAVERAAS